MKKRLMINDFPVKGRLHMGCTMNVILNHSNGEEFIYNNFVNLECLNDLVNPDINLCFINQLTPGKKTWIDYLLATESFKAYTTPEMIIIELIEKINIGYYINIDLDEFFIPQKSAYRRYHNRHMNFIFGYDEENKIFHTISFNERGEYGELDIGFDNFVLGYKEEFEEKNVVFMKANEEKRYEFDKDILMTQLIDYLFSKNTIELETELAEFGINKKLFSYGLSVYDHLISCIDKNKIASQYDYRNLYILHEHKKLMKDRMEFIINSKKNTQCLVNLLCEFEAVESKILILKNKMLKWSINRSNNIIDQVLLGLTEINKREKELYPKLIDSLNLIDWGLQNV